MDHLPLDLQIKIIKKFDMDTRIKTGIIGKIKVPESLINELSKITPPICGNDGYMYSIKTSRLVIMWDEALCEKSIAIKRNSNGYNYWIANENQTVWVDLYEY